ncbi:hypothetical protein MKEN_00568100 [Mycena kentingensis (nom. inval.)]|nr:hypothetical protein MKEN_00568100 [Mycena kentingensis (nom. inval.)]
MIPEPRLAVHPILAPGSIVLQPPSKVASGASVLVNWTRTGPHTDPTSFGLLLSSLMRQQIISVTSVDNHDADADTSSGTVPVLFNTTDAQVIIFPIARLSNPTSPTPRMSVEPTPATISSGVPDPTVSVTDPTNRPTKSLAPIIVLAVLLPTSLALLLTAFCLVRRHLQRAHFRRVSPFYSLWWERQRGEAAGEEKHQHQTKGAQLGLDVGAQGSWEWIAPHRDAWLQPPPYIYVPSSSSRAMSRSSRSETVVGDVGP